jgi:hypothetical protein
MFGLAASLSKRLIAAIEAPPRGGLSRLEATPRAPPFLFYLHQFVCEYSYKHGRAVRTYRILLQVD